MVNYQGASLEEQVKNLLDENLNYAKENHRLLKKINNYMMLAKIMSIIYFILIVGPIVLGVLFLPSIFKNAINNITPGALGESSELRDLLESGSSNPDLLKTIQKQGGIINAYKNILQLNDQ